MILPGYWPLLLILIGGVLYSVIAKKLTVAAAITGAFIALLVFTGGGYTGVIMMTVFFVLGSAATGWKINFKKQEGLAEKNKGKRKASQVFANAGMAAILGLLAWQYPFKRDLFIMMMAAGFASATADTLSSELGNVYGTKFYSVLNGRKDERGLDGVISVEGTLIGVAGSIIIAIVYSVGIKWSSHFVWIVIAGTVGNFFDSFLGATLERRNVLKNDSVNFLNTVVAALVAWLAYIF